MSAKSDTPMTDAEQYGIRHIEEMVVNASFAAKLERELAAAQAENAKLREEVEYHSKVAEGYPTGITVESEHRATLQAIEEMRTAMKERDITKTAVRELLAAIDDMEHLAYIEHERWSRWYIHQRDSSTPENIARWNRLSRTPYTELPEYSKESDRREVNTALKSIKQAAQRVREVMK